MLCYRGADGDPDWSNERTSCKSLQRKRDCIDGGSEYAKYFHIQLHDYRERHGRLCCFKQRAERVYFIRSTAYRRKHDRKDQKLLRLRSYICNYGKIK